MSTPNEQKRSDEAQRCGYAVVDRFGDEQPCDRPATGWRWYQDCDHEDALDVACDWHANEGGRRLAAAEARAVQAEQALADAHSALLTIRSRLGRGFTGAVPLPVKPIAALVDAALAASSGSVTGEANDA